MMNKQNNRKHIKISICKGDKIKIIAGKYKGTIGTVKETLIKKGTVIIDHANKATKHVKPQKTNESGQIISIEKPIHISNIMRYQETE